jgi:lauroyl/myristoyl acyltransferase
VSGVFWYRFHSFGVRVLPAPLKAITIAIFVSVFSVLLRRIRAGIAANLEVVLGPCGLLARQRRVWRTFHDFAWCLSERYENLQRLGTFESTLEGEDHWRAVTGGTRGFIFVTAHFGCWEAGSMIPGAHQPKKVHLVREREIDERAQRFVAEQLLAHCDERYATHFAEDDGTLGVELLHALRRGEIVALQGDRPRAGAPAIAVRMFGREALLPPGPAALARAAEVPLVPAFTFRDARRRYRVVIARPIEVERSADRERDVRDATQRVAAEIEAAIRARPHHWFCFSRFWR